MYTNCVKQFFVLLARRFPKAKGKIDVLSTHGELWKLSEGVNMLEMPAYNFDEGVKKILGGRHYDLAVCLAAGSMDVKGMESWLESADFKGQKDNVILFAVSESIRPWFMREGVFQREGGAYTGYAPEVVSFPRRMASIWRSMGLEVPEDFRPSLGVDEASVKRLEPGFQTCWKRSPAGGLESKQK
ncbi:MAG TPA: hypothetical protein ENN13_05555 [Candidatus Altiarchaeales archaeon]|nr:hypothetical protein [Candidatus Altiarchaeales archaeon]